jgi:DNA polymerase III subunit gamma/tau
MAAAQSLYRRHRPRSFADVVGQEPVVRTLRHAVERDNVHHAYLFVGSRGTGKTSMAKILASCLNCERGPTVEPCGQCDSCRAIASATSLDVIEMDAASNNSVDDIRELRESVVFAPVSGRHKVYILDEAHMLSQAAWNAFLKTLEEPPPHTVFVLATTEAAKVPATVVDRCHRFDFHRPTVEQISSVLSRAAASETIEIPPEAVAAIARSATGSFRDALGTLEQLVTYSGSKIELADVLAVLGVADEQLLSDVFDAVQSGDARAALHAVARCAEGGRDASSFTRDLEARARELLVVQTLGEVPAELSLTPEIDERLRDQAQRVGRAEVVRVLDLLGGALEATRAGADPRTQLELALVKAAAPQIDGSARALLARIERLEQALAGAAAGQAPAVQVELASAPPVAPVEPAPSSTPAPSAAPAQAAPAPSQAAPSQAAPSQAAPSQAAPGQAVPVPSSVAAPSVTPEQGAPAPSSAAASASQPVPEPAPAPISEPPPVPISPASPAAVPPVSVSSEQAHNGGQPVAAPAAVATLPPSDLDSLWAAAHESVRAEHGLLGAVLSEATPVILTEQELTLAFPTTAAFHKRKAEDSANRSVLIETLRRLTGRHYRLEFELREDLPEDAGGNGAPPSEEEVMSRLMAELDAEELPEDWLQQQKGGD